MFTTIEQVKELTGYDVTAERISMAQAIVESYVGRIETNVDAPDDFALLARATAFQTAYMVENWKSVFEQVAVKSIGQFGQMVTFRDDDSPYLSQLTVIACRHLSWKGIRSVQTGSIFSTPMAQRNWWND